MVAPMDIRFGDHPSFHRAALGMVGGSAALALALHQIQPGPLGALAAGIGGIAIGTAIGYGKPAWRIAAAGIACVPLFLMTKSVTAMSMIAAIMGLGTAAFGLRGVRGALAVMLEGEATCARLGMSRSYGDSMTVNAAEDLLWLGRWDEADARLAQTERLQLRERLQQPRFFVTGSIISRLPSRWTITSSPGNSSTLGRATSLSRFTRRERRSAGRSWVCRMRRGARRRWCRCSRVVRGSAGSRARAASSRCRGAWRRSR